MTVVVFDPDFGDAMRRRHLYQGDLVVYRPRPESLALCEFAREMIRSAFGPLDPEVAQFELPVAQYVSILADLKPRFIHHPESKRLIQALLTALDFDPQQTYFDVPRLRTSTSHGYLTTGIAYAFHPHRDTWYSAPMCQINVWLPVFAADPGNIMAFHPEHWSTPVANSSADYDYQRWIATSRFNASTHVGNDTRQQPKPLEEVKATPDLRVLTPVGGIKMFSAAHLHSSLPNNTGRTRFSIDFRIINLDDAVNARGAENVDSHCTGTAMQDYLRLADLAHVPQEIVDHYMRGHPRQPLAVKTGS
jgi:hypothetical protein